MSYNRREFLTRAGVAVASVGVPRAIGEIPLARPVRDEWDAVKQSFNLDTGCIHMSGMLLASHPKPVRDAIERHRQGLDRNPVHYYQDGGDSAARSGAARYLGVSSSNISLTDSTTMGVGLVYTGLRVSSGQEILTTTHDHSVTETALSWACERTGATIKRVSLYDSSANASETEMVNRLVRAISTKTRVVAVTWVHSSTGVRIPVPAMSDEIRSINRGRDERDQIIFCVDGVHGFGVENTSMNELGCDFFMAGTHKWIHGPRGTGIICARDGMWSAVRPTIPSFSGSSDGYLFTPGGFHSFEHRWALAEAFDFHMFIGKAKIQTRIHALNTQMKEGLKKLPRVTVHTPLSDRISAGIICFSVQGYSPSGVVQALWNRRIVSSQSPYSISYARVTPGLLNNPQEVDQTLSAISSL